MGKRRNIFSIMYLLIQISTFLPFMLFHLLILISLETFHSFVFLCVCVREREGKNKSFSTLSLAVALGFVFFPWSPCHDVHRQGHGPFLQL